MRLLASLNAAWLRAVFMGLTTARCGSVPVQTRALKGRPILAQGTALGLWPSRIEP